MHSATEAHFEKLAAAPVLVDKYERQGTERATAIACTALQLGVPGATVAAYLVKRDKQDRTDRVSEVIRLARNGHSNAEIARRIGLHRGTVARIVQRQFRRGQLAAE